MTAGRMSAAGTSGGNNGDTDALRARFRRAKNDLCQAVDLPEVDRTAVLTSACDGDGDLLREVESLLASDRQADSFIEVPAATLLGDLTPGEGPPAASDCGPELPAGTRLGAYVVEALLGSGGMGEVYPRARRVSSNAPSPSRSSVRARTMNTRTPGSCAKPAMPPS